MDKAKKKQIKKITTWVSLALVVALLAAMPLMAKAEAEADGPVASILSGTVAKGDISTVLRGGGTLSANDAQDVQLPDGVKITEFLVRNGDTVEQGDALAVVDKVSVMTAIVEIRETMEYLQEQIQEHRDEAAATTIRATAGGRVKAVYAEAGDSVQDVMLEKGALAVLSLDSLMAVELLERTALTTGDAVTVILSDGSETEGRVESNLDGRLIVTVDDKGYPIGEAVTVTASDGTEVGKGSLYVHNAWKATAFTGTVSSVSAKVDTEVYAGSTLFRLKDTDFAAQLEHLSNQHREYESLIQDLFRMYEAGVITAPCGGQVSGIEEDSPFLLSGQEAQWQLMPLANTEEQGWTVMLLSAQTPSEPLPSLPGTGEETEPYDGTYMGFPGRVTHIGSQELILAMSELGAAVTKTEEGEWDLSAVDLNPEAMLHTGLTFQVEDASQFKVGDIVVVIYDELGGYTVVNTRVEEPGGTFPNIPGMGGSIDLGGLLGGLGGFGGMGGAATQETEPELFELEGDVLMTVTPQDTVSLTITLDEQDIASVTLGQLAEVKVEALRGQTFEAEVVSISGSGTNSGGSSKFTVKLTLPKDGSMLDGMSATASIPLSSRLDVLTIPVKALVETGARTVVYTALNPETGEPAAPVEVTVGMSDGINAEVVSGLQMGDAFYYSYYDTLELDHSAEEARYSFG